MDADRKNFEDWYAAILEILYPTRAAGFVIATIAFPLLERYIRQKIRRSASEQLNDLFYDELIRLFPGGFSDRTQARQFWSAFRNGLLHQVTLQLETKAGPLPPCALTHDIDRFFAISDGIFILHPVLFAKRVIEIIRSDFVTFVGRVHIGPPLATAKPMVIHGQSVHQTATVSTTPFRILGTSAGP